MNIEDIEKLEEIAANAREQLKADERKEYENAKHKEFPADAWVTDGEIIGKVVRNIRKGYVNINIKNRDGGLLTNAKINDFESLPQELVDYYKGDHALIVNLTGEDIEALFMSYAGFKNVNPSKTKTKIIDALERIRLSPPPAEE